MDYNLGIIESLKTIFSGVVTGELTSDNPERKIISVTSKVNRSRFTGFFPTNIFQDEYAILYDIMFIQKMPMVNIDQIPTIIENNRDLVLDSPFVNLNKVGKLENGVPLLDDDKIALFTQNIQDMIKEFSNRYVSEEEFNSSARVFIDWYRNTFMLETSHRMAMIMSNDGYTEQKPNKRKQHYAGVDDAQKYYNERLKILNELSDTHRVRTIVIGEEWYKQEIELDHAKGANNAILDYGITKIDMAFGELRRSNMLGILGPPKGGKTRFTNYLVSRALSKGLNVCVWPIEGTKDEWMSMQIAAYLAREKDRRMSSKDILFHKYENEQIRQLVTAAKLEFINSDKMGKLSFIESMAYVEDFLSILETHYDNENPFDVVVIDPLVNIMSKTGRTRNDRVSEAYTSLKNFITYRLKSPAIAILPTQLKQTTIDYLRSHPEETIDVTAGGESSETIRSPDTVIGIMSTKEERAANLMHMYSVASRHSADFDDFQVRADLKCCHFYDDGNL